MKRHTITVSVTLALLLLAGVSYFHYGARQAPEGASPPTTSEPRTASLAAPGDSSREQPQPAENVGDAQAIDLDDEYPDLVSRYQPPAFTVRVEDQLPKLVGKWESLKAALLPAAGRNDARANFLLYRAAFACYHGPRTEDALDERLATLSASLFDEAGNPASTPDDVGANAQSLREQFEFCKGSDFDELSLFPRWVEVAAEGSDVRAQLAYGSGYPGDDDLDPEDENDAAVLRDRKSRYVAYLEEAKASGSIDAAARLAGYYYSLEHEGTNDNLAKAFANLYAYAWYRLKYEGSDQSFRYLRSIGDRLSPTEYFDAVAEGQAFLSSRECCFKLPEVR
jgi:hypothetical protein